MSSQFKRVALGTGKVLLQAVRYSSYVVLLLVGRLLVPMASLVTVGGVILFFFFLFFMREETRWMIVGAVLAVSGIAMQVFYDAALRLVAPEDVVIVREL